MMNHRIDELRDWAIAITLTVREPLIVLNKELRVLAASSAFYHKFQITKEDSEGRIIYDLGNRQWDIPELRQLLEKKIFEQNNIEDFEMRHHFEATGETVTLINARRVVHEGNKPGLILLAIEDITKLSVTSPERKQRQNEKRQISEILEQLPAGICLINQEGQILLGNAISRSILPAMMPSVDPERMQRWQTFDDNGKPIPPKQWPGARALRGETVIPGMEFVYIDDAGQELWQLVSAVPFDGGKDSKEALVIIQDITEIKQAEEELKRKTAQLEATIDSIPDGYIVYGMDRSIMRMNAVAEEILDYIGEEQSLSYEKRMAMLQLQTLMGESFPIEHTPSSRAFAGETVRNEIMRIVRPHRNYWLSVSAAPIITSDDGMLGVVLGLTDITEHKNAEEALRQSEKRFRGTFENAAVGIALVGLDGEWLLVNDRLCEIVGYEREELLLTTFKDITHPEDIESDLHLFEQTKRGEIAGYQIEKRYYRRDGQVVWISLTASIQRDDEDRPLYRISIVEDISKRKQAEEALRESEEKFRSVFEQAAVGIGRVSFHDARYMEVNDTFSRMVGYTHEELQRTPWSQITHPDDLDSDLIPFRKMAAGELESYTVEKRFIHKKGHHVWARLTLSLVRNSNGLPDYEIAIIENISERKKAEEALQRRTRELAAVNRELKAFSYSVSHDLRAPLRAIIGFSSLLSNHARQLDSKSNEYLQRITAGAEKMNVLIDDMLRLSSISSQELVLQEIDLSSMAQAVAGDLELQYPERHVEIHIADDLKAQGDSQLINMMLTNLLGNAWKYTAKTAEAYVEFGSCQKNEKKIFFIRDNGAGFPMEQVDRLFEPFQRLHSEREFSGTGIGLPIVQRVINRHGGEIWAEGEVGKGAVFYFTLGK